MKRLGKRDEVTRVKALKQIQSEIRTLFADILPEDIARSGGPSGQLYAFIVHYGHIFRRISVEDSSQRVGGAGAGAGAGGALAASARLTLIVSLSLSLFWRLQVREEAVNIVHLLSEQFKGRVLAPILKKIIGVWFAAQSDRSNEVGLSLSFLVFRPMYVCMRKQNNQSLE